MPGTLYQTENSCHFMCDETWNRAEITFITNMPNANKKMCSNNGAYWDKDYIDTRGIWKKQ